jgi:hypothetical protein
MNLDHLRPQIDQLFENLPADHEARLAAITEVRKLFLEQLGQHVAGVLDAIVAAKPRETHEQRSETTTFLNSTARELSLSLLSPTSGKPSIIIALKPWGTKSHPDYARFLFRSAGDTAGPRYEVLPPLRLAPAPARRESLSRAYMREKEQDRGRE